MTSPSSSSSSSSHTLRQERALHIVGIELRTSHASAGLAVPAHWQRFQAEDVAGRIAARLTPDVHAVYTQFEHAGIDSEGIYSLVIGMATAADAVVPDGMVRVTIPASTWAVFPVPEGRFDRIVATWQSVWARQDLPRRYLADYELHHADGRIELMIGIRDEVPKPEALPA